MSNVGTAFLIVGIIGGFIGALYLEIKKSTNYDIVLKVLFVTGFLGIVRKISECVLLNLTQ